MAMIKCPECKNEMSDKAPKCPSCGAPNVPKVTCPECKTEVEGNMSICPKCGYVLKSNFNNGYKSKLVAGVLGILLGSLGIHNFYLGYTSKAVTQLLLTVLSCGILSVVSGIWGLIEGVMLLTGSITEDGEGKPLVD